MWHTLWGQQMRKGFVDCVRCQVRFEVFLFTPSVLRLAAFTKVQAAKMTGVCQSTLSKPWCEAFVPLPTVVLQAVAYSTRVCHTLPTGLLSILTYTIP